MTNKYEQGQSGQPTAEYLRMTSEHKAEQELYYQRDGVDMSEPKPAKTVGNIIEQNVVTKIKSPVKFISQNYVDMMNI